jgi:nucleotide-binding universal stress UspA family protein
MHKTRILVPVSFSKSSENALAEARMLAAKNNGMLTCLHVIEKSSGQKGKVSSETEKKCRRDAEIRLSEKVNKVIPGSDKVPFEIIVTAGKPYSKILEKAAELHVDLIVMGKSDSPDTAKQRLGFNTAKILSGSTIPVLTTQSEGFT